MDNGGTDGSGVPQGSPSVHKSTTDFLQSAYEKQRENVLKLEQERHELKKLRKKNFDQKTPPMNDRNEQETGAKGGRGKKKLTKERNAIKILTPVPERTFSLLILYAKFSS